MKKNVSIVLVFSLLLFSSCGHSPKDDTLLENDNVIAYFNDDLSSNIPLIVKGKNNESLTVFRKIEFDREYIEKVVVQTEEGEMSVISVNTEGYPTLIESQRGRVIYSNYDYQTNRVDIIINTKDGTIQEYLQSPISISSQTSQSNFFIPTVCASEPMSTGVSAKSSSKKDFYIGTLGQVWSIVSCGGGLGLTVVTGGSASPLLYLSCGVFATRLVTSNMKIGSCNGDIFECAKDAVVDAVTGKQNYEDPKKEEIKKDVSEPESEVILDLYPVENKLITDGVYQSPLSYSKFENGMKEDTLGLIEMNFEAEKGTCVITMNSVAKGRPIPEGIDIPQGVVIPEVTVNAHMRSMNCSGSINTETGVYSLSGEIQATIESEGQKFNPIEKITVNGSVKDAKITGNIILMSTGESLPF
jgi:hypothetical protein